MSGKPLDWDDPQRLELTSLRYPGFDEDVVLLLQGVEVPRSCYDVTASDGGRCVKIVKEDATVGDCHQAEIQFRKTAITRESAVTGSRRP